MCYNVTYLDNFVCFIVHDNVITTIFLCTLYFASIFSFTFIPYTVMTSTNFSIITAITVIFAIQIIFIDVIFCANNEKI